MDIRYLRRFLLIEHLHSNQNSSIELIKIVKLLNVSYPTVKKIINEIKFDIEELDYQSYVELTDVFEHNRVIWNVKKNFSLSVFRLYYLEQSYRFRMFSLFLEPKKWTVSDITKKLNITYAMAKKEISFLSTYFQLYAKNIKLNHERKIFLQGDEITIRLLYTGVFQNVYGGYKWPFLFISTHEVSEVLSVLAGKVYQEFTPRFLSIRFGLAVSLLRAKKQPIPNNPYYWSPANDREKNMYEAFINLLKRKGTMINTNALEREAKFLISCLIANDVGNNTGYTSDFFMNNPKLEEINFSSWVGEKLEVVEQYALRTMTKEERMMAKARLNGIFYQILLYKEALQQSILDLFVHHPFEFPENKERERTFYRIFMKKAYDKSESIESDYVEYLCVAYYKFLFFELDRYLFHPKIRIFIMGCRTPEMLLSTKMQTIGNYFLVEVVKNFSEDVDLIISDIALSTVNNVILPKRTPIVYLNSTYCAKDSELLQETLTKIADEKYKQQKIPLEKTNI